MRYFAALLISSVLFVGPAQARPEWADPMKRMTPSCQFMDQNYIRTPCNSSGTQDARNTWRQHLGTDFSASAGDPVVSPVNGTIVIFEAESSRAADQAFLVIRDLVTKEEHVIGHVQSNLSVGATVTKGMTVATVRDQGSNTHLHWGFNIASVASARTTSTSCLRDGVTKPCAWGWGKAPYEATTSQVAAQGWRNVL